MLESNVLKRRPDMTMETALFFDRPLDMVDLDHPSGAIHLNAEQIDTPVRVFKIVFSQVTPGRRL